MEGTADLALADATFGAATREAMRQLPPTTPPDTMALTCIRELEADLGRLKVVQAPGDETRFGNQDTDGSRSMRHHFDPLRRIAAAARQMLEQEAAARWRVPVTEVKAALLEAGCVAALMSGSGPTVFGIAPSYRAALRIRDVLGTRPWRLWVARTVTGPVLTIRGGGLAE